VRHVGCLLKLSNAKSYHNAQHHILWVPAFLYPGVKLSERGIDHSAAPSAEVKNERVYNCTPHLRLIACAGTNLPLPLPFFTLDC